MMESTCVKKYVGISRRKIARLARECVREDVAKVRSRLMFLPQKASRELLKAVLSAAGNYQVKNPTGNTDELLVKHIFVDVGPSMKRMMPRARGKADRIVKRSCHIRVILTDGKMISDVSETTKTAKNTSNKDLKKPKLEGKEAENKKASLPKKVGDKTKG